MDLYVQVSNEPTMDLELRLMLNFVYAEVDDRLIAGSFRL